METKTNAIHEIVSRLRVVDPFRIVLFGSLALETEELESDIDLLVIISGD